MTNNGEENHFCRCCLSKECYKDMANVYYIGKKTENYFEMLMDIFNINISNHSDTERCLICEECVSKIRDAAAFKKQVLNIQEMIKNKLYWNKSCVYTDTIIDPKIEDEDFVDDLSDSFTSRDFMWNSYNPGSEQKGQLFVIELKCKKPETITSNSISKLRSHNKSNQKNNNKDISTKNLSPNKRINTLSRRTLLSSKKKKNNPTNIDASKTTPNSDIVCYNSDDSIQDTRDFDTCNDSNAKNSSTIDEKGNANYQVSTIPKTIQVNRTVSYRAVAAIQTKEEEKSIKPKQTPSLAHLHSKHKRENTLKLVINSNLCLFRSFQNKYGCNFCPTKFTDFNQLREHSISHYLNKKNITFKLNRLRGLTYKNAEISNLKCNVCSEDCADLTELTKHLKNEHDISFHGTEHYLVPYKLQNGFQCMSCDLKFNSYLRLSIHMNSHYANNVCEMCGRSFINRLGLRTHVHSMHTEKKCSLCTAVFETNAAKVKHMRLAHNKRNNKRYCNLCNKSFPYTYLVNEHKISEHGVKRQVFSCDECGKTFFGENNLKVHLRSVHVKERNYPCTLCGMRFFTKCDQKRHERTHEDVRSFSCSYCESKFKSKDSWRRHLKRQHGHVFGDMSYSS